MESHSSYHLPDPINASFQELIKTYNSQESPADIKTESLEKINEAVQGVLNEAPSSQEAAQEVIGLLKQINVQPKDENLWNQIMGKIEKAAPTLHFYEMLPNIRSYEMLNLMPTEIYQLIMGSVESIELFDKFSPNLSPEQRFQIALQCGEKLTRLDLSNFKGLDSEKLETLSKTCPNLQSLNLSGTAVNESLLHSFSKLEKLDLTNTWIATLDTLPKSLKELNLTMCDNLLDKDLQQLHSFPKLEKLNVSSIRITTVDVLPKSLKELNLAHCFYLKPEELQKLNSFSTLEKLNVSGTQITTLGMLPKSLKELDLSGCNLTTQELKKLASFPNLQLIYLPRSDENEEIISLLRNLNKQVIIK